MQTLTEMQYSINQITVSLTRIEGKQNEHSQILNDHTQILDGHTKILNDHTEKFDQIFETLAEHSIALDTLIEWADDVQTVVKIPFAKTEKID